MPQQTFRVSGQPHIQIRGCQDRVVVIGWDDAQAVAVRGPAQQEGDTIRVENGERVELRVPRSADVDIAQCDADLRLDNLAGRIELAQIGGDVALDRLSGETRVRDLDGDLVARQVASLNGEGPCEGDVVLRETAHAKLSDVRGDVSLVATGTVTIHALGGDLTAHDVRGALILEDVRGDVHVRGLEGELRLDHARGDLMASAVNGTLEARDVGGDAVVSLLSIHELHVRADGDIVLSLPQEASAQLELDAPRGDVLTHAPLHDVQQDQGHLVGAMGNGGPQVKAESRRGDIIVQLGGEGRPGERRHHEHQHHHPAGDEFASMGHRIAAEVHASVRQSLQESLGEFWTRRGHGRRKWGRWTPGAPAGDEPAAGGESPSAASAPEDKPHGPAAGSPERQAILDAIARGELSVDEAIRKLTGE